MTHHRFKEPRFLAWMPLIVIALLILLWQSTPNLPVQNDRFMAFGTMVDVSIIGVSRELSEQAVERLEDDFEKMHQMWHAWDPGPLERVNEMIAEGKTFSAPTSVLPLIKIGQQLAEQSDNLFNPAIGQLIDAWGFHETPEGERKPPEEEDIKALLEKNPLMSDISIDGFHLSSSNPAVKLDFGAFGKGYGIDMAINTLKEMGIDNAIVNAGGDLRAMGSRDGKPWRIAVRSPDSSDVLGVIKSSTDESVFTSGDYERNFDYKGKRYHHIIDPRTGYPTTEVSSVTVIHSDATTADAAATALFVAGPELWHKIAKQMGIKYVLMIDKQGTLHMNPAMQKRLELLASNHPVKISDPL